MHKRWFSAGNGLWFGCVRAALVLAAAGSWSAFAAERMVISEEFTALG